MNDMSLIAVIGFFWLILAFSMSVIASDASLQSLDTGNASTSYTGPAFTNFSDSAEGQSMTQSSWLSEFGRMFTFSIGTSSGFPSWLSSFISIINYMLLLFLVLITYRLIRSGGN